MGFYFCELAMDLTVKDAARLLNTTENTLYRWIHDGTLPCYRVNEKYRLNRVELLEWATARKMKISPEIFTDAPDTPPKPMLLAGALQRGGVKYDLEGTDKKTVLKAVCDALPLGEAVNRTDLYSVLLAREALSSTAIGNGIAIPHPRSPIVLGVNQPTVILVFLKQPIDFGALDGKPVTTLFTIISTTVRLHLQVLSHLMYVLQNQEFQSLLASRAQPEVLHQHAARIEAQIGKPGGSEGAKA
jgi:nitrogen PTS system EIIA component